MICSVVNLGCKVNKYECDALIRGLEELGLTVYDGLKPADVFLINTCAVTAEAEKKSRQMIARILKLNPTAHILVMGCASENNPEAFEEKQGVCYVSGTSGRMQALEFIKNSFEKTDYNVEIADYEEMPIPANTRTRAFIKIQDGCDNFCSYCLIPYLRGRSRSREVDKIVAECEEVSKTSKEIVLTGINISDYRESGGLKTLVDSLSHIDVRIRLGSLEAPVIKEDLLESLRKLKNFCPHFHLSLQSGDNEVLKKMDRHYTTDEFFCQVEKVRKYFPNAGITTDIICGFPTETDEQFENTLRFAEKVEFSDIHVFGYSRRKGTKADKIFSENEFVIRSIIDERVHRLTEVKEKLANKFLTKNIGFAQNVLIEEQINGKFIGYSENYIRVATEDMCELDTIQIIKPDSVLEDKLIGKIVR